MYQLNQKLDRMFLEHNIYNEIILSFTREYVSKSSTDRMKYDFQILGVFILDEKITFISVWLVEFISRE